MYKRFEQIFHQKNILITLLVTREIQIKITRYHYISTRMTKIKKSNNTKC